MANMSRQAADVSSPDLSRRGLYLAGSDRWVNVQRRRYITST